jgi:hypothetical protein
LMIGNALVASLMFRLPAILGPSIMIAGLAIKGTVTNTILS